MPRLPPCAALLCESRTRTFPAASTTTLDLQVAHCRYMPPAGKKVATFMWTDPMTGKAKSKPFTTFFSGAQTMKILVKDLPDRLAGMQIKKN